MRYNIDFCVLSLVILLAITIYCFLKRRVTETREVIFRAMLVSAIVATAGDIVTAVIDAYGQYVCHEIIYAANFIYIGSAQLGLLLYFAYAIILGGWTPKLNKIIVTVCALPYVSILGVLLASPFTEKAIYYIDKAHVYHTGPLHWLLYANVVIYMLGSLLSVALARKTIIIRKRIVVMSFTVVVSFIFVVQILNPFILLNTTASMIGMLILFLTLHTNSDQTEKRTKTLDVEKFNDVIDDLYTQNQKFDIIVYSQSGFRYINSAFGVRFGDEVLAFISEYLKRSYPDCFVYHIGGDSFAVIVHKQTFFLKQAKQETAFLPSDCIIKGTSVRLNTRILKIQSEICKSKDTLDDILDYIVHEYKDASNKNEITIDDKFLLRMKQKISNEAVLRNAIESDSLIMYLQPIVNNHKTVVAAEVLARLKDDNGAFIPPDVFIRIAETNGMINKLGEQMLRKLCTEYSNRAEMQALDFISINVSIAQCMRDDLADRFVAITNEYNVPPPKIHCEITETQAIDSVPAVRKNLLLLKSYGFHVVLDDFGAGYANFNYLTSLPIDYVKFDRTMLLNGIAGGSQKALFSGLAGLLSNMGIITVCEGIETEKHEAFVSGLGIDLYQGYKYSKPIDVESFAVFMKERKCINA